MVRVLVVVSFMLTSTVWVVVSVAVVVVSVLSAPRMTAAQPGLRSETVWFVVAVTCRSSVGLATVPCPSQGCSSVVWLPVRLPNGGKGAGVSELRVVTCERSLERAANPVRPPVTQRAVRRF